MNKELESKIQQFIVDGIDEEPVSAKPDEFWQNLKNTGTELWLDTGDMDEAVAIWSAEMTALTTNNTLVNNEIQKGIYDDFIAEAKEIVKELPIDEQVVEIAFILNARHGLRLAKKFGGFVSVELHTNTAHDLDAIVNYGKRYHAINPKQFIVKVPYTATGLIGARKLRELGIKINFTLEFSVRQNLMVAAISKPNYLNVFLGRLGAYIADNKLGEAEGVGERAVIETQRQVTRLTKNNVVPTKLIAASLRSATQLESLAGVDVYTMPTKVASAGKKELSGNFTSKLGVDYEVSLTNDAKNYFVEKLWRVSTKELELALDLDKNPPKTGDELIERARNAGLTDMFPILSETDFKMIDEDGKIPVHEHWKERIAREEIAIDTLLNLAGLASFTNDQAALDERIKEIIQ